MDPTIYKIQQHLNQITTYLSPLLPLANCHMVEFLTADHWRCLVPSRLRESLDAQSMVDIVEQFWKYAKEWKNIDSNSELGDFVKSARSHCIPVDNEICLTVDEFKNRIRHRNGHILPEIRVKEFMSSKKGYEVKIMSSLVASLFSTCGASHCVDVGGGRGQLPAVLELGYGIPGLTVDCDKVSLDSGLRRDRLIRKQWHAIAEVDGANTETLKSNVKKDTLHRYAHTYVTEDSDLCALVRNNFGLRPGEEVGLFLTGLHTCGDLGPSSLRVFVRSPAVRAVLNVPCCYHLLSERHEPLGGCGPAALSGFPMSQYLQGYRLGRNARMSAAHSVERAAAERAAPPAALLHRALLQVVMEENLPRSSIPEGKLKRVRHCDTFTEYFKAADDILHLDLFDKLPSGYIQELMERYEGSWRRLVLFYLLRLSLAQVVEGVILLDRLLFLKERGFSEVFLVKLFEPVLSPRCHGIVAIR